MKIGFVSLGCPKNQLDTEVMLHHLLDAGYEVTPDETEADIIIINTCAFIEDAKKEAIDNILDIAWFKENRSLKGIIVTGCMPERYREAVLEEFPEVDAVLGVGSIHKIVEAVKYVEEKGTVTAPAYAVGTSNIVWVDKFGQEVDFSSIVIMGDTSFTAKSTSSSVYYTVRYWYEDASGEVHQIGDDFLIDFGNGETIPHDVLYNIETEVESLTEKNIINWRCEISDDQLTVDWYAELN